MEFFRVEPATVRQLSAAFQVAAERMGSGACAFRGSAHVPRGAFGRLPQGAVAGSSYERKLAEAVQGLSALQGALEQMASNLAANADTYAAADQANLLE
jgi:uncharacterized protein YukE